MKKNVRIRGEWKEKKYIYIHISTRKVSEKILSQKQKYLPVNKIPVQWTDKKNRKFLIMLSISYILPQRFSFEEVPIYFFNLTFFLFYLFSKQTSTKEIALKSKRKLVKKIFYRIAYEYFGGRKFWKNVFCKFVFYILSYWRCHIFWKWKR